MDEPDLNRASNNENAIADQNLAKNNENSEMAETATNGNCAIVENAEMADTEKATNYENGNATATNDENATTHSCTTN